MDKHDMAKEFMNLFNETYGTEIDNFSDLFDTLAQKIPEEGTKHFLMHTHDIPTDHIRLSLVKQKSGNVLCVLKTKEDGNVSHVLFAIVIHSSKDLRNAAKILNIYADNLDHND